MTLFNNEQMLEMCRARERLLAIKNKAQPYPEYPFEEPPVPEPAPTYTGYRLMQLESGFLHLQNTINEHVDAAKKAKEKKYTKYTD